MTLPVDDGSGIVIFGMARQLSFFKVETQYGGSYSRGRAKTRRPFAAGKALHVTLRSSKAKGEYRLTRYRKEIQAIMLAQAERWEIKLYERSVNSNHLHLALRSKTRESLQNFLRAVAGLIARKVTGARKGRPFGNFWDETVWSRIVEWGKAFTALVKYVRKNVLESFGAIPYERKHKGLISRLRINT